METLTSIEKQLLEKVEASVDALVSLTQSLVKIPSQNIPPHGQEIKAQEFIHNWLSEHGIKSKLIHLDEIEGLSEHELFFRGDGYERREYKDRPNLAAKIKGKGGGKTLIFSGHIDTMPAGQTAWSYEPFSAHIDGNKMFGRGSFDMKGGIAAEMMAIKILKSPIKLAGDIIFETVVDEEHAGCNGTLANRLLGYNGDAAIIPEPSSLELYYAHKGFRIVHLTLRGKSGMSFAGEEFTNPVEYIGSLIECFKKFRRHRRKIAPSLPEYSHDKDPVPVFMNKLQAGEFSLNIPMQVPESCKLEIYWQMMPGETREAVEKEFFDFLEDWINKHPELKKFDIERRFSHRWMPGTKIDRNEGIVRTIEQAANHVLQKAVNVTGAPYPCDLFVFNHFGIPGVIIGPKGANCHGSDEYVEIDSLVKLTKIFLLTAMRFCSLA